PGLDSHLDCARLFFIRYPALCRIWRRVRITGHRPRPCSSRGFVRCTSMPNPGVRVPPDLCRRGIFGAHSGCGFDGDDGRPDVRTLRNLHSCCLDDGTEAEEGCRCPGEEERVAAEGVCSRNFCPQARAVPPFVPL